MAHISYSLSTKNTIINQLVMFGNTSCDEPTNISLDVLGYYLTKWLAHLLLFSFKHTCTCIRTECTSSHKRTWFYVRWYSNCQQSQIITTYNTKLLLYLYWCLMIKSKILIHDVHDIGHTLDDTMFGVSVKSGQFSPLVIYQHEHPSFYWPKHISYRTL